MTCFEVVGLVEILGSGEGRCFAPYEAKDGLKSLSGRRFDPARRCWVVPARHVEQAKAIIRGYVDRLDVVDTGTDAEQAAGYFQRRGATDSWADALLASLPPDLRKPPYRALLRVLQSRRRWRHRSHPDADQGVGEAVLAPAVGPACSAGPSWPASSAVRTRALLRPLWCRSQQPTAGRRPLLACPRAYLARAP